MHTQPAPLPRPSSTRAPSRCAWFAGIVAALCASMAPAPVAAQGAVCPAPDPVRIFRQGFEPRVGGDLAADGDFGSTTVVGSTTRDTRVTPWTAYVPSGAVGGRPLVLLAPGFMVPAGSYATFARHLATHGSIAVIAEPTSGFFGSDHVAMALDLRAVIDSLLQPGALPVPVEPTRIAAGGHSLGGKIAVIAAGGDPRIRALLLLDPVDGGSGPPTQPSIVPDPMGAIAVPVAIFGQLTDTVAGAGGQACTPAANNYRVIYDAASTTARGYEWTIGGASHMDFVSDPNACGLACSFCQPPTAPVDQTRAFIRAASVAFLRTHLVADVAACDWLTGDLLPGNVAARQRVVP